MLGLNSRHELPTVLLVDDDMVSREVMATLLTMSGYAVHTAGDGTAAVSMLAAQECVPGIILMDAQMPGLSGLPLVQELRARSHARLYVISGSYAEDIAAAADGFLLKPFPPEELTRLIRKQEASSQPPKPAGLNPEEAVLNYETVAQLREMMPETAVRQIFEAIVSDIGRRTSALEIAMAADDWPEVRRLGHTIKGGASMAGAAQVARLGRFIESGALEPDSPARVNQLDNGATIIQDLRAAAANLQRILDAEFKA
jgi:CheY-like chemotaxis protein